MTTINESEQTMTDVSPDAVKTMDMDSNVNDPIDESEFTRKTIDTLGNRVRLTDKDEATNLELFCYVQCNPSDNSMLRQCRGVVFHQDTLVMRAFPYTVEFSNEDVEQINENIGNILNDCTFYDAHEGTLIRMFYFQDRWFISTHRKLNAFRSKWASRESFGTAFKRALEHEVENNEELRSVIQDGDEGLLERFQNTLDKTKQYMFLIRNSPENRIVCSGVDEPVIYHVGTFVDGVLVTTEDCKIKYPTKYTFSSTEELVNFVKDIDISKQQGIICFAPENKQYKIIHKDYQELFRARGNEPSIKFRYIQMRMNRRVVDMLHYLYPEMSATFEEIENNIYDVAKNIYNAYVQRFIKKKFVTVPTEDFAVIKECHKWHEMDRVANRINIDKVIEVLNQQTPTAINRMVRRFRTENNDKMMNKQTSKDRIRSNTITSATEHQTPPAEDMETN
jgi:hypothetical protein